METKVKSNEKNKVKRPNHGISLQEAKKYLQLGEIAEVAKEVGIGKAQASNVMKGRSTNWAFVEKILERAERNKAIKARVDSF
jgi:hypothetical protein